MQVNDLVSHTVGPTDKIISARRLPRLQPEHASADNFSRSDFEHAELVCQVALASRSASPTNPCSGTAISAGCPPSGARPGLTISTRVRALSRAAFHSRFRGNIGGPSSAARSTDSGLRPISSQMRSDCSGRGTTCMSLGGRRRSVSFHVTRSWPFSATSRSSFELKSTSLSRSSRSKTENVISDEPRPPPPCGRGDRRGAGELLKHADRLVGREPRCTQLDSTRRGGRLARSAQTSGPGTWGSRCFRRASTGIVLGARVFPRRQAGGLIG